MTRLRPWQGFVAAVVLFAAAFWVGLVTHFPGAALSGYLESEVRRRTPLTASVAPAELHGARLTIPGVSVYGPIAGQTALLAAFRQAEIPISWSLFSGVALRAALPPSGELDLFWPWGEGTARLSGRAIRLDSVPALASFHQEGSGTREPAAERPSVKSRLRQKPSRAGAGRALTAPSAGSPLPTFSVERVQGTLEFEGEADVRTGQTPEGRLRGRLQDLQLDQAAVLGFGVPVTRLREVRFQVGLGNVVRLESLDFLGDIQGSVTGSVTPHANRIENSTLDLRVELAVSPEWTRQLGALAPLAESFLDAGRLAGSLRGTPARPQFRPTRNRS
jgi:hypothetical protein